MSNKVFLQVLLPATQRYYGFRVPLDVSAHHAARLISHVLAVEEPIMWKALDDVDLMLLEGEEAGTLLPRDMAMRELVGSATLVNGSTVALA